MRLEDKAVIVAGAGQTPGETIGNGRATAILFAREGARLLLVDRDLDSAEETRAMIEAEGGTARVIAGDVTREADCVAFVAACCEAYGRIDVLHNNVGSDAGDGEASELDEADWDRLIEVNLKGAFLACKHALPVMRTRQSGAIVNVSSTAAIGASDDPTPLAERPYQSGLAYKAAKAGLNALTQQLALENARHGIRVNAVMPGYMHTPLAIEQISELRGIPKDELIRRRDAQVPLRGKMGTAWDVAHAALFLASDEARFVTAVVLPVDGGGAVHIG